MKSFQIFVVGLIWGVAIGLAWGHWLAPVRVVVLDDLPPPMNRTMQDYAPVADRAGVMRVAYDYVRNAETLVFMGSQDVMCLTAMKNAMRAMDEFVPKREPVSLVTETATLAFLMPCQDDDCLKQARIGAAEAELATVKRREDAIGDWKAVKRECWR